MIKVAEPMSSAQALSIGIEAVDEELKKLASSWTNSAEDKVWRSEFTEAKKVLSSMKYENEVKMLQRTKGTPPTSFKELRSTLKVEELNHSFTTLTNNIVHSDLDDKPSAIASLVQEYSALVETALNSIGAKKLKGKALDERVQAILAGVKLQKPASGIDSFYPNRKQVPPLENTLFSPSRNGKANHK